MKSALECYLSAVRCERSAHDATGREAQQMLLDAAAHWRMLGDQAKAREAREALQARDPSRLQ